MNIEMIEFNGTKYAEIIWNDTSVNKTTFFSPPESSRVDVLMTEWVLMLRRS